MVMTHTHAKGSVQMAHALHDMIEDVCDGRHFCSEVNPPDGSALLQYIRNASFTGLSLNSTPTYLLICRLGRLYNSDCHFARVFVR